MLKTAVVIPNWNGERLLKKNLPKVLKVGFDEVVVVDDASTDKSVEELKVQSAKCKAEGKILEVLENEKNLGFARTVNKGVAETNADVVFLLNTDVVPKGDIIKPVLKYFKDPKIFGVSLSEEGYSWARPKIENGFLGHEPGSRTEKAHETFWVSGGSGAFKKSMWNELGGLDTIYSPFYWEDLDLSYRALKRGWKLLWTPAAKVLHEHEATINKRHFSEKYLNYIKERNQLIFHWKNLGVGWLLTRHLLGIVRRLRNPGYLVVVFLALLKLPFIVVRRLRDKGQVLSDEEVLAKFGKRM